MLPSIQVKWGPFWPPDVKEQQQVVSTAKAAKDAGFIDTRTGIRHVARVFGIENVKEHAEAVEKERLERQAEDLAKATELAKHQPPVVGGGKPPNGPPTQRPGNQR